MNVPPPSAFFVDRRASPGSETMSLALGEVAIEFSGLDGELRDLLQQRYEPYASIELPPADVLRVRVAREDRDYFIEPSGEVEFVQLRIACDGDRVRYVSYRVAGWFDAHGGKGELLLARGRDDYEPTLRAFENYVRAAVAWQAASRGGLFVHAASAVWQGKGYLFYGESGAGKSTLSASNRRAQVVSDDLSLLLPGDNGLELVGSPFRGTYEEGEPFVGRVPLVAGFRLIQAQQARVTDVPRARAMAELVGNLPFVAEAFPERPDLFAQVAATVAGLPLKHLEFTRDDGYWDAIAAAGL